MKKLLCASSSVVEGASIGLASEEVGSQDIFVVRRDGNLFAYINSCPHTGVELNWQPDAFLDVEGFYIQCAVHGARFEVETGRCVWGPCANQSLSPVSVCEENNQIWMLGES